MDATKMLTLVMSIIGLCIIIVNCFLMQVWLCPVVTLISINVAIGYNTLKMPLARNLWIACAAFSVIAMIALICR